MWQNEHNIALYVISVLTHLITIVFTWDVALDIVTNVIFMVFWELSWFYRYINLL